MDFILYELLDQHLILASDCLDAFPGLKAFHAKVEQLPNIKAYIASDRYFKGPLNNRMAKFGQNKL